MIKQIKRIMGLMAVTGMLMFPVKAIATDGQLGIYVTPKIIYGLTYMKDVKVNGLGGNGTFSDSMGSHWDSTLGGSLAVGYDFSKRLRVPVRGELEYAAFTKAEVEEWPKGWPQDKFRQSNNVQTLFVNAYYDINTGTRFTPYVGAGIGAGFIRTKGRDHYTGMYVSEVDNTDSKTVTNFAWNIGLGLGYQITNNIALDMGYRFADLGKVKTNWLKWSTPGHGWELETKRLYQHQFSLGARFTF